MVICAIAHAVPSTEGVATDAEKEQREGVVLVLRSAHRMVMSLYIHQLYSFSVAQLA